VGKSRRPFTLIELFVSLAILAIVAGAMIFNIRGLYVSHQLGRTVKQVVHKLRELQTLALSYQKEFILELTQTDGGIGMKVSTDEPLSGYNQKPVFFDDHCSFQVGKEKPSSYKIEIEPTGSWKNRDEITISRSTGEARIIDLKTPLLIKTREARLDN
jgi:type II secretory pathway pseudopilin PulG